MLKSKGLEVILSRTNDKTLSLNDRTSAANSSKADCFISIHCNAFNGEACGVETYSYSTNTNDLATDIHEELLKSKCYTKNRGTKTANFYVIKNTNMRACLIELGFIDNIEDSKLLLQKQDNLAEAIARGFCKYLNIQAFWKIRLFTKALRKFKKRCTASLCFVIKYICSFNN